MHSLQHNLCPIHSLYVAREEPSKPFRSAVPFGEPEFGSHVATVRHQLRLRERLRIHLRRAACESPSYLISHISQSAHGLLPAYSSLHRHSLLYTDTAYYTRPQPTAHGLDEVSVLEIENE